jgi:hypothetical protein
VQPHVVASGLWTELSLNQCTPQWKYRVGPSVSRSKLADIQWKKRATPARELELEAGDIHLTVLFEMSIEQRRHTGGNTESSCGYTVEVPLSGNNDPTGYTSRLNH